MFDKESLEAALSTMVDDDEDLDEFEAVLEIITPKRRAFLVRMDSVLHTEVKAMAFHLDMSMNDFMVEAAKRHLLHATARQVDK